MELVTFEDIAKEQKQKEEKKERDRKLLHFNSNGFVTPIEITQEVYPDGSLFVGCPQDNKPYWGGYYNPRTKGSYRGFWLNNQPHGSGIMTTQEGCYTGQWKENQKCGNKHRRNHHSNGRASKQCDGRRR